jgi:hypothetical protein
MQTGVIALQGMRHGPHGAAGEDHDSEPAFAEFSGALHLCLAAFHHIGQQRYAVRKLFARNLRLLGWAQHLDVLSLKNPLSGYLLGL